MNIEDNKKVYNVNYLKGELMVITGKGTCEFWDKAEILSNFVSPWNESAFEKIEFRALWDTKNLCFQFKVFDPKVYIDKNTNIVQSINNSDRVELFFRINETLNPYYCLEIDPTPRVMDFKALPNKVFDFSWDWPKEEIVVRSSIYTTYFTVEGSISLASLTDLGLLNEGNIEAGIYRAKYNIKEDGHYIPTWISWVNPKTKSPNFHTPKSFGVLKLV
jgi:hypothetical protein